MEVINITDVEEYLERDKIFEPGHLEPAVYLKPAEYNMNSINGIELKESRFKLNKDDDYVVLEAKDGTVLYAINKDKQPKGFYSGSENNSAGYGVGRTALPTNLHLPLPYIEIFGNPTEDRGSWWDECKKAALDIKTRYNNVIIPLSGGIDSELTALAFMEAGIDFESITVLYEDKDGNILNDFDVKYAKEFAEKHNIKQHIHSIDLVDMITEEEYLEYMDLDHPDTYFCLPHIFTHHYIVEQCNEKYDAVPVMASDQTELRFHKDELIIGFNNFDPGLPIPIWADLKGYDNVYSFFNYSPNQIAAYLDIDEVINAENCKYKFKENISKKYGSNLLTTRPEKWTGYEHVKHAFRERGIDYHESHTIPLIDMVDWKSKHMCWLAAKASDVRANNNFDNRDIVKMAARDYLVLGFEKDHPSYVWS